MEDIITPYSTKEQVYAWFSSKYPEYTKTFQKYTGEQLLKFTEPQIEKVVPGLDASAIFNDLHPPTALQALPETVKWVPPYPLVSTLGASWTYQIHTENLTKLRTNLILHYESWMNKKTDKQLHPLFLALSGAGTGKSRLLQEFPFLALSSVSQIEPNPPAPNDLIERLKNAFVFNVTLENGTLYIPNEEGTGAQAIGSRMLYQLMKGSPGWPTLQRQFRVLPEHVIDLLARSNKMELKDMTIILCVDGLQRMDHEVNSKNTPLYGTLGYLASLLNDYVAFLIVCVSATITLPVDTFLQGSPQLRIYLELPPLSASNIIPNGDNSPLIKLLIDDIGGHGRALEAFCDAWSERDVKTLPLIMEKVKSSLANKYPDWITRMSWLKPILRVVLGNQEVGRYSIVEDTDWSVDQICSLGLIRYQNNRLQCPFIWIWLLGSYDPEMRYLVNGHYDVLQDQYSGTSYFLPTWQQWETFNAEFRCMRSHLYPNGVPISFHQLHHGALLNIDDFNIINHRLSLEKASYQYKTSSNKGPDVIQTKNGTVSVSKCNHIILGTGNSSSGDAWCQLDCVPPKREIHQYKLVNTKRLSITDFNDERQKAASSDDIFLMFTIDESDSWKKENLPLNSGLINADNAREYYGPWSGRVFYMCKKLLNLYINTMNRDQILSMPSIGPTRADTILQKRPYSSLNDAVEKTQIPRKYLNQFTFLDDVHKNTNSD